MADESRRDQNRDKRSLAIRVASYQRRDLLVGGPWQRDNDIIYAMTLRKVVNASTFPSIG